MSNNKSIAERLKIAFHQFDKSHIVFYVMFAFLAVIDNFQEIILPRGSDTAHIVFTILNFFSIIAVSVLYLMKLRSGKQNVKFIYFFIPYLLYSIYYSIIGLLGLVLLFIPGIIFYYLPIIATLNEKASPFKGSIKLFKNDKAFTIFIAVFTLLAEIIPASVAFYLQNSMSSQIINLGIDLFSTFVTMIITIAVVNYYDESIELLNSED